MIKDLSIYETNKIPFKTKSVSRAWEAAGIQKCCLVCMRPWIWCPVQDSKRQCGEERGQQGQKSKWEHSLHSSCKHYLKRTPRLLGGGGAVKSPLSSSFVPSGDLGGVLDLANPLVFWCPPKKAHAGATDGGWVNVRYISAQLHLVSDSLDCGPPLINILLLAQRWHLEQNDFPPLVLPTLSLVLNSVLYPWPQAFLPLSQSPQSCWLGLCPPSPSLFGSTLSFLQPQLTVSYKSRSF